MEGGGRNSSPGYLIYVFSRLASGGKKCRTELEQSEVNYFLIVKRLQFFPPLGWIEAPERR